MFFPSIIGQSNFFYIIWNGKVIGLLLWYFFIKCNGIITWIIVLYIFFVIISIKFFSADTFTVSVYLTFKVNVCTKNHLKWTQIRWIQPLLSVSLFNFPLMYLFIWKTELIKIYSRSYGMAPWFLKYWMKRPCHGNPASICGG